MMTHHLGYGSYVYSPEKNLIVILKWLFVILPHNWKCSPPLNCNNYMEVSCWIKLVWLQQLVWYVMQ